MATARRLEATMLRGMRPRGSKFVVQRDRGYHGRSGFVARPILVLPGVPSEHFQMISLDGT